MWCTTSGIKVLKWPEAFLRLVIGKCLALGLEDMGGISCSSRIARGDGPALHRHTQTQTKRLSRENRRVCRCDTGQSLRCRIPKTVNCQHVQPFAVYSCEDISLMNSVFRDAEQRNM